MAVENVVLAAPCIHLDGWQRLTLSHGEQDAAQSGVGSRTHWPEAPVEYLRSTIDRAHDPGDRDELFTGVPKLPIILCHLPQQRKTRTSAPPRQARRSDAVQLPPQPIKVEGTVYACISSASRRMLADRYPLQE